MVLDEAQHLSDHFLCDLSGFLNFAFDSRDLLTLWLVGLSPLAARLRMRQHAALTMRVAAQVHLEPLGRDVFAHMLEHGLKAAGAQQKLFSDPAVEQLFRASRGIPRQAAKLVRAALRLAHERDQSFVDDLIVAAVVEEYAALARTA
jgi:type II secretory pathway predicted ATPase ExeA